MCSIASKVLEIRKNLDFVLVFLSITLMFHRIFVTRAYCFCVTKHGNIFRLAIFVVTVIAAD